MTFRIIDNKTGKEPTDRVISNIARKGGLMEMDIDGFYVDEDGQIILVDDCGNCTWVDAKRFKVEHETGHWIWQKEDIYKCSECGEDIHVKEVMNVPQYVCCPMCGARMERSDKE